LQGKNYWRETLDETDFAILLTRAGQGCPRDAMPRRDETWQANGAAAMFD